MYRLLLEVGITFQRSRPWSEASERLRRFLPGVPEKSLRLLGVAIPPLRCRSHAPSQKWWLVIQFSRLYRINRQRRDILYRTNVRLSRGFSKKVIDIETVKVIIIMRGGNAPKSGEPYHKWELKKRCTLPISESWKSGVPYHEWELKKWKGWVKTRPFLHQWTFKWVFPFTR